MGPQRKHEAMTVDEIIEKLLNYGVLGLIALGVFFALRKYGPMVIDAWIAGFNRIAIATEKNADNSERQAESTEKLVETGHKQSEMLSELCDATRQHHDPKGAPAYENHIFSTTRTNKALQLLCQAKLLETTNQPARELIDEAIRVLDGSVK